MNLKVFLFFSAVCLMSANLVFGQAIDAVFEEDFESTESFSLPDGWMEINFTDPVDGSYQAGETTSLANSSELEGWTVLTQEQLASIDGNRVNTPAMVNGNVAYSESDKRGGLQHMFLYTPAIDLRGKDNILLRFDSNYTQNQDNIAYAEYTLDGDLPGDDGGKTWYPIFYWVDSDEIEPANGDVYELLGFNAIDDGDDWYELWVEADFGLINFDEHIEGRLDDNQTSSKKTETFALPLAANQQHVQIKFFHGGGASWYWSIDNVVVGSESGAASAPLPPSLSVSGDSFLDDLVLVGGEYSHPDGVEHRTTDVQIATDIGFTNLVLDTSYGPDTTITIPKGKIPYNMPMYARIRYVDNNLLASGFSAPAAFTLGVPSNYVTLLTEDFEGLPLEAFVDEDPADGDGTDWTHTPPTGWTVDNSIMTAGGVTEWNGWSFADIQSWVTAAGDQDRSQFTGATGTAAITDPDEWDDLGHDAGTFDSFLVSPSISLSGVDANSVKIAFCSSWRPEDDQKVTVTVSYDGGAPVEIMRWTSGSGDPTFKTDATSELVVLDANNPAGASNMVVTWGMIEAGNDWWWAIDNVAVIADTGTPVSEWPLY